MAHVEDIIEYIKSLRKGFDKDLFHCKMDDLTYIVDNDGLDYNDFHTLFKVWLNLNIPIATWSTLGVCLVPRYKVQERTVEYSHRWLLANYENHKYISRIKILLDWLTAAVDCEAIDICALDYGYEIFYSMLSYEEWIPFCLKLVYKLTKPVDVTRKRVLELLSIAKKGEAKKILHRQIQVLLGLFKSYRPECVPENIPSTSTHSCFRKVNATIFERFKQCQSQRTSDTRQCLIWNNPLNYVTGSSKRTHTLLPNIELLNIGSNQYSDKVLPKTFLDFSDSVSLLQHTLHHGTDRPARLSALLSNDTGLLLLALSSDSDHAFISFSLQHTLNNCFFDLSSHSYIEKQIFLQRLASFQRLIGQGIPVITIFLAQYLPVWNEMDFFAEILSLVEWVDVGSLENITSIMESFMKIYYRANPMRQCQILKSLSAMYTNLVYASTKEKHNFMSMKYSLTDYTKILLQVSTKLNMLQNRALQINPEDLRILYSTWASLEECSRAELIYGRPVSGPPGILTLALPLLTPSLCLLDTVAEVILMNKKLVTKMKKQNLHADEHFMKRIEAFKALTCDMVSFIYNEKALSDRNDGIVFSHLTSEAVETLKSNIPDMDSKFSIRNHLAFAPYTYAKLRDTEYLKVDNTLLFNTTVAPMFENLSKFFNKMGLFIEE